MTCSLRTPLVFVLLLTGCSTSHTLDRSSRVRFHDAASETGLKFTHQNGSAGEYHLPEIMGSGVALLDYDNDGDLDVLLVQGTASSAHRLFRNDLNETGKLHFTDISEQAGITDASLGMGAATGDYDGDGYVDVFITGYGRNILYHNNGNGTFTNVTQQAGLTDTLWSTSAAFLDYDRDGKLDLVVLHYVDYTPANNKICHAATGERDYCTPKAYKGVPARLYHNLGRGRFQDVSVESGIAAAYGPGLGVAVADLNEDGWPDIYVANDTARNLLWLNQKNGTFREAGLETGVACAADGVARAGMGVSVGDFDGDGASDIIVTNLMREGVTLFHNSGRGSFEDMTPQFGLVRATVGFTGFGTGWFDCDNDGDLDLFVANGAVTIMENQRGKPYPYEQTNQLLLNEGKQFRDISGEAGEVFRRPGIGRGAAFGDVDNDGDIDIVVTNNKGPVQLLLNDTSPGHWLTIRTKPLSPGARVQIGTKFGTVHTDGSYFSASDPRVHFGLGDRSGVDKVVIRWPDGVSEQWTNVPVNRILDLAKGSGSSIP